uniref:Uncharacterized protein n=1 Tax=Tetranychus urticae TaxID=32264 RepID=T1KDF8_TETUR
MRSLVSGPQREALKSSLTVLIHNPSEVLSHFYLLLTDDSELHNVEFL